MKLISINRQLLNRYAALDSEIMLKDRRPTVLVIRLKYRGARYDFAVPLRSNIAPASPKNEYFALPNRSATRPKHHHGLHYIKMFPVAKPFYERYRTEGDISSTLYLAIIDKNEKKIVDECQAYLDRYAAGSRPAFSTDIDKLLEALKTML